MINTFILFIIINGGGTTHITNQEFNTYESCQSAKEQIMKTQKNGWVNHWSGFPIYVGCIPK